jgi:hypothetical protein
MENLFPPVVYAGGFIENSHCEVRMTHILKIKHRTGVLGQYREQATLLLYPPPRYICIYYILHLFRH